MKMERSAMLGLGLRDNTRETDKAAVMALDDCKGIVNNVVLCVPTWPEAPLAIDHPLVRCAIAMLSAMNIKIVWGRKAFVSWRGLCAQGCIGLEFHDAFRWEFWYELLYCLHREQQHLHEHVSSNVVGTFINTESDGPENPMRPLKKAWEDRWYTPLHSAAWRGMMEAGCGVTRVSPCHGSEFAGGLSVLGNERDERQTYYTKPPFTAVPPSSQFEWWNTLVEPDGKMARGAHAKQPKNCCTPAEAMQFDQVVFERLRKQIPGLRGQTIYAHPQEFPEVVGMLKEAGR